MYNAEASLIKLNVCCRLLLCHGFVWTSIRYFAMTKNEKYYDGFQPTHEIIRKIVSGEELDGGLQHPVKLRYNSNRYPSKFEIIIDQLRC